MPRMKKAKGAGKAETGSDIVLTQGEREALYGEIPATDSITKTEKEYGTDLGDRVDQYVDVSEDKDLDIDSILVDESHLSTGEKVGRLAQLYRRVGKMQLVIGLWVLLNVFRNSLEDARSKDPTKRQAFNNICNHPELPEDLKGDTLNRYVVAAATMKELQGKGVDTGSMEYYHFREISKIRDEKTREKVAREVILRSLTVRETQDLAKAEVEKGKAGKGKRQSDKSSEPKISDLAASVIVKLDHPSDFIIPDEATRSLLVDSGRLLSEFDFGDRAAIYQKAKTVLKKRSDHLGGLKHSFSMVEADVDFLEELIRAIDGKLAKADTD